MKIIVITDARPVAHEMDTLVALLERGASVHVRKPGWSADELHAYLQDLPDTCRKQISLHENREVASELGLGGFHLKSNQPGEVADGWKGRLSRSFHSLEAAVNYPGSLDYGFLGPVFDSISKRGYRASLDLGQLQSGLPLRGGMEIYALGGISPEKLKEIRRLGFDGAAVLGTIWQQPTVAARMEQYEKLTAYEN